VNGLISLFAQDGGGGGGLFSILILVLPLGALLYLMIIPQRKQKQKHAQFVSKLAVGDDVVTAGGLFGTISYIDEEEATVHLEVDTDVVIKVSLSSLASSANADAPDDSDDSDDAEESANASKKNDS